MSADDLQRDLAERWRPSQEQIELADLLVVAPERRVYTLHLLINKTWGWWTKDVEVLPLDGVFTDFEAALEYLANRVEGYAMANHKDVIGGYTVHSGRGEWAVFDAIGTEMAGSKVPD